MILETNKIIVNTGQHQESRRPALVKWKGEWMVRNHSIQAAVSEIVKKSKNRDVVKVGIIGEPDTGKSTQADTISHLLHTLAKKMHNVDFVVKKYEKKDFMNIRQTLSRLEPANYILQFGDLSFLKAAFGIKKIEELQGAMTEIRHMQGGRDVKIIIVYDYHYTKGLPPYLRQSDYKFFTGVGSSEKLNMEEIVSQRFYPKMLFFKKISDSAPSTEKFTFKLGTKGSFTYKYRNPFIPMLFWNEISLRIVVSPTRQWVDPLCSICALADNSMQSTIDLDNLILKGRQNFKTSFDLAVKNRLQSLGINVFGKTTTKAMRWLDKILACENVDLEDLAAKMNFTITKTYSRYKIDEVRAKRNPDLIEPKEPSTEPELDTTKEIAETEVANERYQATDVS